MPTVIIKPDRDADFYVAWSTVVDGPGPSGTREELMAHVADHPEWYGHDYPGPRFDRADEFGSSAQPQWKFGWWDDDGLIVNWDATGNKELGPRWIDRDHLGEWLKTGDESLPRSLAD